jgi:hypothetical protein
MSSSIIIRNTCFIYLVLFHPQESDSLEALSKEMSSGFAGCVHFSNNCDIKVLILLYGSEKKSYLGFIPNDQGCKMFIIYFSKD